MKSAVLYPRRAFVIFVSFFIVALYPCRALTLYLFPDTFQFLKYGVYIDFSRINLLLLSAFIFSIYIFAVFVPRRIVATGIFRYLNLFRYILIVQFSLLIVSSVFLGAQMGVDQGLAQKIMLFLVYSLVPFDLVYFFLAVFENSRRKIILFSFLYVLPSVFLGSKAGLINMLMIVLFSRLLKRERVLTFRWAVIGLAMICLYPSFIIIAHYVQMGEGNFIAYYFSSISMFLDESYFLIDYALSSISRRVSGIDILMISDNYSSLFGVGGFILYLIKGLFSAGLVDSILGLPSYGIGRSFAIEYLAQSPDISNGFEVTLFGFVNFSPEPVIALLAIVFYICSVIILLKYYSRFWINRVVLIYFLYIVVLVLMTGTVLQLGQVIRTTIVLHLLVFLFSRVPGGSILPRRF